MTLNLTCLSCTDPQSIRAVIALLGCSAFVYFDLFNKRNIPNELSYGFLVIAAIIDLATFNQVFIINSFGIAALVFVLIYVFYRTGQIGGADVFLFASLALLFPEPTHQSSIGIPPILSIFVLSGIFFALVMLLLFVPRVVRDLIAGKVKTQTKNYLPIVLVFAAYLIVFYFLIEVSVFSTGLLALLITIVFSAVFFMVFKEHIADNYLIEVVPFNQIDEEDILAIEKMDQEIVRKHNLQKLLTSRELEKLKKLKQKKFPVYKNLPAFTPYVFAALLAILLTDPMAIFISFFV